MARTVQIAAGLKTVQLPNGFAYDGGALVVLTDDQYKQIKASLFPGTLIDLGPAADVGDEVVDQGSAVAQVTTANGIDLATTQALANALKTKVNELLAALSGVGKPLA